MLTGIENGFKKFIAITVILLCSSHGSEAQPTYLQPEIDVTNGLQSNSVRVIREDDHHRIWLGTDQGLVIVNDNDSSFKNITAALSGKQIYGLAIYKKHVFIGSRFNGLYIFDLSTKQLEKHFDTAQIGLCLKVKEFRDTIFFGTSKSAFYLFYKEKKWVLKKIACSDPGVFPDFALWSGKVYAAMYVSGNQYLYQFQNDSMVRSPLIKFHEFPGNLIALSITANDSLFVLGGDGFNIVINQKNQKKFELLRTKQTIKSYPAWDAEIAGSRVYLALGNPDNNQEGMIYEPSKINLDEVNGSFYGQSLYYDYNTKGMWAGTSNNGLYYWPAINESYRTPKSQGGYRFKPMDNNLGILFNREKVLRADLSNNEFVEIFDAPKENNKHTQVLDARGWGDTTAILFVNDLFLIAGKKVIKSFVATQGNYIHKNGDHIYVFSLYYDLVVAIDLRKNTEKMVYFPSNQIKATPYNKGNLFYHSTYTGFYYFDSVSHSFNIPFPLLEDYTILSDTLWTLQAGVIKTFKIDLPHYKLIPLFENNIKEQLDRFSPKWLVSCKGHVYCGDDNGIFDIETKNGYPRSYTYLGNFSQAEPPTTYGNYLYFNRQNYITRIDPDSLKFTFNPSELSFDILPEKTIYRQTPFSIRVKANDYLIQKDSLKEIQILKSGKMVHSYFTLNDQLEFPSGIKNGDYTVRLIINGTVVGEKNLFVKIPLTANPLFYLLITLFVVAFFFILFRSILNKRSYDRHILDNRLQLLKQNLNPHFVFNSLNLIYSLVLQRKNEAAIKTINNFSDLHRYYLDNINKPTITFEEEIKFIESYLKLESGRVELDSPFVYNLPKELDNEIKQLLVPPMILQPLVENAVKFCGPEVPGLKSDSIWIDVKREGMKLIVGIENTIANPGSAHKYGSGLGLKLVQERIEIFNKTYKRNVLLGVKERLVHCNNGYRCELTFNLQNQYTSEKQ